uniref:DOMON domain-containing protein n=1 Tax=Ascaris lumbricoides TaxID=6252 RepID=A0A0M3IFY4_ASCLU
MDLRFVQLLWFLIQTSAQFDTSTCGVQKGCFLNPPGCDPLVNCMSAFSYRTDDDSILMEINGVATNDITSYVAVGFSNDKRMVLFT